MNLVSERRLKQLSIAVFRHVLMQTNVARMSGKRKDAEHFVLEKIIMYVQYLRMMLYLVRN